MNQAIVGEQKTKVFTKSYCLLLGANFLLFFAFYLIMPVLPLYLQEEFGVANSQVGVIISSYTIAALLIRPFSGYFLDTFMRKPLYLFTFLLFTLTFGGYIVATTVAVLIAVRVMHGLAFGVVTVAGNTIVIDVLPSERRGEGLGYFGLSNNLAMSFGPMTGLLLHTHFSFNLLFLTSLVLGGLGFALACFVQTPAKPTKAHEPLSLDRFVLVKGIPAGVSLLCLAVPYGMTSTYIALYALECGVLLNAGLYFTVMSVGLMVSRLFSGRLVDKGWLTQVITFGIAVVSISYLSISFLSHVIAMNLNAGSVLFLVIALMTGIGFGSMFPAYNTLFVNLGRNDQRGTATSTFLIAWDLGIGFGLLMGGFISEMSSFAVAYRIGTILCVVSLLYFIMWVRPHYNKNKLR